MSVGLPLTGVERKGWFSGVGDGGESGEGS